MRPFLVHPFEAAVSQTFNIVFYLPYHFNKGFIALSGWIGQAPILVKISANERAAHITPHGNRNVGRRNFIVGLTIVRRIHINAVELFYESNSILVDLRLGLRSC